MTILSHVVLLQCCRSRKSETRADPLLQLLTNGTETSDINNDIPVMASPQARKRNATNSPILLQIRLVLRGTNHNFQLPMSSRVHKTQTFIETWFDPQQKYPGRQSTPTRTDAFLDNRL